MEDFFYLDDEVMEIVHLLAEEEITLEEANRRLELNGTPLDLVEEN